MKLITVSNKMTGKLNDTRAINTNCLTNPFCMAMAKNPKTVCHKCYAIANSKGFRKTCVPCWERHSQLFKWNELVTSQLPTILAGKFIRLNAYGELLSHVHYTNYANIARKNPDKIFSLYTKRPNLVDMNDVPENMVLVYSSYLLNDPKPRKIEGFHHTFTVYTFEYIQDHKINMNCSLKCSKCRICYSRGGDYFVNEVIKSDRPKMNEYEAGLVPAGKEVTT